MTAPAKTAPAERERESHILHEVLLAVGGRADCRIWRANSGAARDRKGRLVRFGLPGQADILGLTDGGRFLAIECKSEVGRLSPEQLGFRDMIINRQGLYIIARSAEEAMEMLDLWKGTRW